MEVNVSEFGPIVELQIFASRLCGTKGDKILTQLTKNLRHWEKENQHRNLQSTLSYLNPSLVIISDYNSLRPASIR